MLLVAVRSVLFSLLQQLIDRSFQSFVCDAVVPMAAMRVLLVCPSVCLSQTGSGLENDF